MLNKIKKIYVKFIKIKKDPSVYIDRSLSKKFSYRIFKYSIPNWDTMIKEMQVNKKKIYKNLKIN